jgi:putative solute:sodium symporter small subunit
MRMTEIHIPSAALKKRQGRLRWTLMLIWFCASFGPGFFARDLAMEINGWPIYFWMAAQGSVLVFVAIVVVYAWLMNRWETQEMEAMRMRDERLSNHALTSRDSNPS